jgi:hypothetical protein
VRKKKRMTAWSMARDWQTSANRLRTAQPSRGASSTRERRAAPGSASRGTDRFTADGRGRSCRWPRRPRTACCQGPS